MFWARRKVVGGSLRWIGRPNSSSLFTSAAGRTGADCISERAVACTSRSEFEFWAAPLRSPSSTRRAPRPRPRAELTFSFSSVLFPPLFLLPPLPSPLPSLPFPLVLSSLYYQLTPSHSSSSPLLAPSPRPPSPLAIALTLAGTPSPIWPLCSISICKFLILGIRVEGGR